ncbi:MAG: bifunctional glutamine synthetase adenylyltransferase/deadenyltransferase [Cycloclasticus sp. symbiont of Poecilosclerida sp. N]|nr:MAG: bifunctional glutamine synthetase adenylyltransferase/deadenyltransferase [Cycloclasticus sp. symbiont of Poecilosclerida sp. N]
MRGAKQRLNRYIEESLSLIPDSLHENVATVWEQITGVDFEGSDQANINAFTRVLACSAFVQKQAIKHRHMVVAGFSLTNTQKLQLPANFHTELKNTIAQAKDEAAVQRIVRQSRNQKMLLITWAQLTGADINDVIYSLSELADCYIQIACNWTHQQLSSLYGAPRDAQGAEQKLIVIGMGKLGAKELNFSSDIDLIFCYPSVGETDGLRLISNEEFFTRQCRLIIKLLDQNTVDGFVFRVDTRLRPFGDSGALVLSGEGMEMYYQSHAREWERYAMIKARLITGNERDKVNLTSMLRAFVFRRYLDYGVFDSVRVMKRQIEAQLQRKGVEHNVKLGVGGIREIEFIGQAYQLINGGRDKSLQQRGILKILNLLAEKNHISKKAADELTYDYAYLRRLENHLQEINDQQTHVLPSNELDQARLLLAMNVSNWELLLDDVRRVMARVHAYFEGLVDFSKERPADKGIDWQALDAETLEQYLASNNIVASRATQNDIIEFCNSYSVRQLAEKGREYFIQLMPMLLNALLLQKPCEKTLSLLLIMLENICNRTVYLVLLVENKAVFEQLVRLAMLSPLIITQVTKTPILLDELIDPASLYHPPTKEALEAELKTMLLDVKGDDIEGHMETLRLFKQVNVLRVAAADLTDVIPLMVVSDKLTSIAEVVLQQALLFSWQLICAQYGVPEGANSKCVSGFSVIGFGKMGGMELGFSSDLDIIFLHKDVAIDEITVGDKPISLAEFYMRLGRKVITFMTTRTFSGSLYEMDLRLRPNGNSGLLVTSESSFSGYQKSQAWTWEHQALIRARFVAGCKQMGDSFNTIRAEVLAKRRDTDTLRNDVVVMRKRMRTALLKTQAGYFDLKHGIGGIVDIEFIVQFGVLVNASEQHALLTHTDNVRLLLELQNIGFLSSQQEQGLSIAYKTYRKAVHHAALAQTSTMVGEYLVEDHVQLVTSVWNDIFNH